MILSPLALFQDFELGCIDVDTAPLAAFTEGNEGEQETDANTNTDTDNAATQENGEDSSEQNQSEGEEGDDTDHSNTVEDENESSAAANSFATGAPVTMLMTVIYAALVLSS